MRKDPAKSYILFHYYLLWTVFAFGAVASDSVCYSRRSLFMNWRHMTLTCLTRGESCFGSLLVLFSWPQLLWHAQPIPDIIVYLGNGSLSKVNIR